jgi:hypothetical protein
VPNALWCLWCGGVASNYSPHYPDALFLRIQIAPLKRDGFAYANTCLGEEHAEQVPLSRKF